MTKRKQQILEFIRSFIAEKGYSPSVRDICAGVGLASTSTVWSHVMWLIDNGYLEAEETHARTLRIPEQNQNLLSAVLTELNSINCENDCPCRYYAPEHGCVLKLVKERCYETEE